MRRMSKIAAKEMRGGRFNRRGGAVLEAALVLPILTVLAMGMMEFGYYLYAKHTFEGAARDACRAAILNPTVHANVGSSVGKSMKAAGMDKSKYLLNITDQANNNIGNVAVVGRGEMITVTVTAKFGDLGVRPLGLIPSDKQIAGVTTMIKE